jgi:hypothetical protein
MKMLHAHRWWLIALSAAFLLLVCSDPLSRAAHDVLARRLHKLEIEQKNLTQSLEQLRGDAAIAERLNREIKTGEADSWLAPVDRRQIAAQFEPLAAAARLSRFTYTLSPEQPVEADKPSDDMNGLVQSSLTLEADAPHDADAYRFIGRILRLLPGHAQLRQLVIERLNANGSGQLAATNIRLNANIDWLSNGTMKTEGKEP